MRTPQSPSPDESLRAENAELRERLEAAEETLRAIRAGEAEVLVVVGEAGGRLLTLQEGRDAEQLRGRGEMIAQVSDAVVAVDLEQRITFLNAAAGRLYGVQSDELLGHKLTDISARHWPSPEEEAAAWSALRLHGAWHGQYLQRTYQGREVYVNSSFTALRDAHGDIIGYLSVIRDITERMRVEEEKREALRLLDTLLARAPVGFAYFDRELRYIRVNERLAEINGLSIAEHLGRTVGEIVPTMAAAIREVAESMVATGQPALDHELAGETASAPGVMRHWNINWFPVHSPLGEITGFGAVVDETTERKHAEEARQRSEKHLHHALKAASAGAWDWDVLSGDIVWSPENFRLFDVDPAQGAPSYADWESRLHPEDRASANQHVSAVLAGQEAVFRMEFRIVDRQGAVRWVLGLGRVERDEDGHPLRLSGLNVDITERKHTEVALRTSEARFRAAVGAVSSLIWTNNARGEMEGDQSGWSQFTGQSREEYQGYGWARAVHPEDAQPTIDAWNEAVAEKRIFGFEHRVRRNDGEWRVCEVRAVPVLGEAGEICEWVGVHTDITERKQIEKQLLEQAQSLQRLAAIVESSHDAIVSKDLRGTITSWNRGAEIMFGYSAEEMAGQSILRLLPAERRHEEDEILATIMKGEALNHFETVRLHKDGSRLEVSVTVSPVRDAAGAIIGASKVARDITARRQAEAALRGNVALFTALIAQAPMGTYVVDAELRLRQINAEAMPVFANLHPLIGRGLGEVLEVMWGPELSERCADIFRITLATGEPYVSPPFTEMRDDLGVTQTYEWQTQRVTLPDGQYGVACYFHEVTERTRATEALRASQERMRLAAEATGVGIWEWNVLTNAVQWDSVMFEIYGITPTPDGVVLYSDWSGAVLPEDLAESEAILQETVRRCGRSTRSFRIRRRDDGECRHIECVETVRVDAAGQATFVLGTNLDVTERIEAERAILEAADKAVAANLAKDRFLAALSHELRTPLTPVLLVSGLRAKSKELSEDLREDFEMIHRNVVLEAQLIDDLLDVSRIQQGKMRFDFRIVDVHEAIARSLEMLRFEVEEKGIAVRQELRATPALIEADPTRLRQVLSNLLRNAVKFTPSGGNITVRTARDTSDLLISIVDTGAGIDAEDLERIFEAFEQVDQLQKSEYRSLGLGLAISASIVAAHHGRIWAESPGRDQGATFHVRLPVEPPPEFPPP